MTEVSIDVKRNHYRIKAIGHAGKAEVCHGISALMYMIAGCMLNRSKHIHVQMMDEGMVFLDFDTWSWRMKEDVRALTIGLLQIQEAHPEHIKVEQNIF